MSERRWFLIGVEWAADKLIRIDVNGSDELDPRSEADVILAARRHGLLDGSGEAQRFYRGVFAVLQAVDEEAREAGGDE